MNRIDLPHLVWAMESLVEGRMVNRIVVDADDAHGRVWRSTRCWPSPGSDPD